MILEQLPRTTKTVIKEGFSSYIHPKSIREDEIKDMRVDMRNTLKELNAHYLERVQKLKKDKEDLKSKRRLEKIASVTASNPSSDAIEEKVSDDHMMNDDELSDTSSTASSKVVPLSPVAKKLAGSAFKSTAIDGHDRGQFNDSELWPEAQTQTQIQTLSSQNSDVITVASDVENYIPARFEQIVNNDDEMPITRGFARTATALKSSTNKKPAKQLLEYESDSVQPPLDDAVLTSQDSDGSITVDLFAGSGDEDISVSASGGVKKLRKSNKSAVAAVDDQNLNTPKEDLLVNYFKTNFEGQPTLMPTDEQSSIHSADI